MPNLVVWLLAIPVLTAMAVALLGPQARSAIRWISLGAVLLTLLLAAIVAIDFAMDQAAEANMPRPLAGRLQTFRPVSVPGAPGERLHEGTSWVLVRLGQAPDAPAIHFFVGIDGLNVWLVVLTTVLMVSSVLISWSAIHERVNEYYAWLLALQTGMMGVFLSFDIILFYVFFELTLVPLFFLIGIWGGPQRRYAAQKFFIYTLTGSVITLLGLLGIVYACYTTTRELSFSIPRLVEIVNYRMTIPAEQSFWYAVQFWAFLGMMAGFSIKVPLVPLHTWLPLAHVEAPTAGSVLLAGVLLKIGAYGFLRLCLPLAPHASVTVGVPLIGTLAVIGIVYGALCALAQSDIKKLVAYSSVSHLGFCMLGLFALNRAGLSGGMLQMVNHGLSTGALFLIVGMLYERYHTRMIADYSGMGARLRLLSCFMVFICLTSIGLPGLNGFVGEVLVLLGIFQYQWVRNQWPILSVIGSTGMVLGAWYLLTMLMRVFFGPTREPELGPEHGAHVPVQDLNWRELAALAPIAVLCVAIGVYPQPFLATIQRDIGTVVDIVDKADNAAVVRSSTSAPFERPAVAESRSTEIAP